MSNKYRSKLERKAAALLGEEWLYEDVEVEYTVEHIYTPDFSRGCVHIEVKGFWRPSDLKKYLSINEQLKSEGHTLMFAFSNPNKPQRKGAKLTMGGWCEKHGIPYCSVSDLKEVANV